MKDTREQDVRRLVKQHDAATATKEKSYALLRRGIRQANADGLSQDKLVVITRLSKTQIGRICRGDD